VPAHKDAEAQCNTSSDRIATWFHQYNVKEQDSRTAKANVTVCKPE